MMTLDFAHFGSQSRMTTHAIDAALGKVLREQRREIKAEGRGPVATGGAVEEVQERSDTE